MVTKCSIFYSQVKILNSTETIINPTINYVLKVKKYGIVPLKVCPFFLLNFSTNIVSVRIRNRKGRIRNSLIKAIKWVISRYNLISTTGKIRSGWSFFLVGSLLLGTFLTLSLWCTLFLSYCWIWSGLFYFFLICLIIWRGCICCWFSSFSVFFGRFFGICCCFLENDWYPS